MTHNAIEAASPLQFNPNALSDDTEWVVLYHGDFSRRYEISVVKKNNLDGQKSWGKGGPDKIILFGSDNINKFDATDKSHQIFMMLSAKSFCKTLNNPSL